MAREVVNSSQLLQVKSYLLFGEEPAPFHAAISFILVRDPSQLTSALQLRAKNQDLTDVMYEWSHI